MPSQVIFQFGEPVAHQPAFQLDIGRTATLRTPLRQGALPDTEKLSGLTGREQHT